MTLRWDVRFKIGIDTERSMRPLLRMKRMRRSNQRMKRTRMLRKRQKLPRLRTPMIQALVFQMQRTARRPRRQRQ